MDGGVDIVRPGLGRRHAMAERPQGDTARPSKMRSRKQLMDFIFAYGVGDTAEAARQRAGERGASEWRGRTQ